MEAADLYYKAIRGADLLTASRERELFALYRTCSKCGYNYSEPAAVACCPTCSTDRNLHARSQIVNGAVRYVAKVARDYLKHARGERHGEDLLLALVSAGNYGLLIAVDRFDLSRGTRFLTYAAWWVREKILEELDSMGSVRVPAYYQKALRAKWRDGTTKDVEFPGTVVEPLTTIEDTAAEVDPSSPQVTQEGQLYVRRALSECATPRERYVAYLLSGVREEPKTLRQVAARLGVSPEAVRDMRTRTYRRLREHLSDNYLEASSDVF